MKPLTALGVLLRAILIPRATLALENLALRQQLAVLRRQTKRPRMRQSDRGFWALLKRLWPDWRSALAIVRPETIVRWNRSGFRLFWRWKSCSKGGRPKVERPARDLIRRMSRENPTWGAPRIQSELKLLGYDLAESTVAKYMFHTSKPPSQTWKTFLANHIGELTAIDFFTVPTATFRVLYVFVVLRLDRRRVLHFPNVTANPSAL